MDGLEIVKALENIKDKDDDTLYLIESITEKTGFFSSDGKLIFIAKDEAGLTYEGIETEYLKLQTHVRISSVKNFQTFEDGYYNLIIFNAESSNDNIFDFINVVKGVQKSLGLKDDGIVGNNTLAAFQQNGINSFDKLKNFARVKASRENWAQNQVSQVNLTAPTPQLNAPQTGGLIRENKKIKVSENELRKLIKESVETILKGYKK